MSEKQKKASPNLQWMPLPTFLVGRDRQLIAGNAEFQKLFPSAESGSDAAVVIRNPEFLNCLDRVIENRQACECKISIKGQNNHYFTVWVKALSEYEGQFIIQLMETTKAFEAERMRSTFVADVSHELRSPLTTMIATLETLKGRAGEDATTRARFLDMTATEASRMHRIIDELLALSATEVRQHIRPNNSLDLKSVLENIVQTSSERLAEKNITVSLNLAADLPTITGDRDALIKVFQNLLDNAINYGNAESVITISLAASPDAMSQTVAVNNYGDVISARHIPRLTERFYRVDKSRSRHLGGTGLGLAIVKHILSRHHTRLDVTSNELEGTTFSITLARYNGA